MLVIRTSKSCGVTLFRVADTSIFGLVQRIGPIVFFFERDILRIRELRSYLDVFFFTMSPKVLGKVIGFGQNRNLLWECDHWTKVRLRRDKLIIYDRETSPL